MLRALASLTVLFALAYAAPPPTSSTDLAQSIADVTLILSGGAQAHEALHSLRARGYTRIGNKEIEFVLFAARPDRLRIETPHPDGSLVRATDGVHQPWTRRGSTPPRRMSPGQARDFLLEADFDHPFFKTRERGMRLDYLGPTELGTRPSMKLRLLDANGEESILYVDEVSRMMVRREIVRPYRGRNHVLATAFADFQLCLGVLLPRRVTIYVDDRLANETVITELEANPPLPADAFAPPTENWPLRTVPGIKLGDYTLDAHGLDPRHTLNPEAAVRRRDDPRQYGFLSQ